MGRDNPNTSSQKVASNQMNFSDMLAILEQLMPIEILQGGPKNINPDSIQAAMIAIKAERAKHLERSGNALHYALWELFNFPYSTNLEGVLDQKFLPVTADPKKVEALLQQKDANELTPIELAEQLGLKRAERQLDDTLDRIEVLKFKPTFQRFNTAPELGMNMKGESGNLLTRFGSQFFKPR